jgi:hypothetical protein
MLPMGNIYYFRFGLIGQVGHVLEKGKRPMLFKLTYDGFLSRFTAPGCALS